MCGGKCSGVVVDDVVVVVVLMLVVVCPQQQMHAQAGIPHGAHAPTLPMAPHPSLPGMPGLPPSSAAPPGLLSAVSSASLMGLPTHPLSVLGKPDLGRSDDKRERPDDRASSLLDERAVSTSLLLFIYILYIPGRQ